MKTIIALLLLLAFSSANAQSDLLNGGFENVTIVGDTFPNDWHGMNGRSVTDAHSGTYALVLWTSYMTVQGIVRNGDVPNPSEAGTPIATAPDKLVGQYKHTIDSVQAGTNDSAWCGVVLTHYDALNQQRDTVGSGEVALGAAADYQPFELDITYTNTVDPPDTVRVTLLSCLNCFCTSWSGICSHFFVDDLHLSTATGMVPLNGSPPMSVFADATGTIHIEMDGQPPIAAEVFDATGQLLRAASGKGAALELNIADLSPGVLVVRAMDVEGGKGCRTIIWSR